ncbi:hypothetical protein [Bacillus sp. 165]|uniref:hypothetical protein n=1 Tax=Bacillus sp. 165 TaxID=1529117 RepID=UPI001ADBDAB4|nr:hypothetical protein [Bacillus sp. 165]
MPYHKNKQQAFQAAQQGTKEAMDIGQNIVRNDPDYAQHLKELKQEVNEAYMQIENALEVASETQRQQLEKYQQDLQGIMSSMNEYE